MSGYRRGSVLMSVRPRWHHLTAAAVAVGLAVAPAVPALAARQAAAPVSITIAAKSPLPKITGYTLVEFRAGSDADATVRGTVTGAASGATATLLARPFGASGYAPSGRPVTLGASPAAYSFPVRPQRATSYEVRVAAPGGGKVLGTSAPVTVYVGASGVLTGSRHCGRPVCHIKLHVWVKVPASAYRIEAAKHWYLYSRLRLNAHHVPGRLKVLELNSKATASRPRKLHAYEFLVTLHFTFRIGRDAYRWQVNFCTKDSEHADGLGLPGRHGCGSKWIPVRPRYLG
jgi:hypothetical protein